VNSSDVRLFPDMASFSSHHMPSSDAQKEKTMIHKVMCDVKHLGKEHNGCPRTLLRRVIEKAAKMGYTAQMFGELEWYNLNKDGTPQDAGHYCCVAPDDKALLFRHELADLLCEAGVKVKRIHHEAGPGQNEVELKLTPPMKNADDLLTTMNILQMLADKHGIVATALPKPLGEHEAGSGFHQHHALYDKDGKNVFAGDWSKGEKISEIGHQFIAGLLTHAREIAAVFGRHEQSWQRLRPGHEAPVLVAWGMSNRTALVRIPEVGEASDTRIEFRAGDFSGSAHVLCAVLLAAGLDGIEKKMKCPPSREENLDLLTKEQCKALNVDSLPSSRDEAREILKTSAWLRESIGEHAIQFFLTHG